MVFNLSTYKTIANKFLAEIRDENIQKDSMRFRRNLERIGEVLAFEISKTLDYQQQDISTPLGVAPINLPSDKVVLATILRAGLPMHQGFLNYFDDAECSFVSAYRKFNKGGSFDIEMQYISTPDLTDKVLIIADPMLATGASLKITIESLLQYGQPKAIHIATAIASQYGIDMVRRFFPDAQIWAGAIDEELTAKSYIVPGLGDAGDLAFGTKPESI